MGVLGSGDGTNCSLVSCMSRKCRRPVHSPLGAELLGGCSAVDLMEHVSSVIIFLGGNISDQTLYMDNYPVVSHSRGRGTIKGKGIIPKLFYYLKWHIQNRVKLRWMAGTQMPSDVGTKVSPSLVSLQYCNAILRGTLPIGRGEAEEKPRKDKGKEKGKSQQAKR